MTETVNDIDLSAASLAKNKLLMDCYRYMQADKLVLPTIPDVSFKIRRAINDDKASSTSIARVVQIDPSITGRLIQISNSPLYRGRKKNRKLPGSTYPVGTARCAGHHYRIRDEIYIQSKISSHRPQNG